MSWPPFVATPNPLHVTTLEKQFSRPTQTFGGTPKFESTICAETCQLTTLTGYINDPVGAAQLYVQLHDLGATPIAAGAVPKVVIPVKGVQLFSLTQGLTFNSGLVIGLSTTEWTFTAATAIMCYQCTFGRL